MSTHTYIGPSSQLEKYTDDHFNYQILTIISLIGNGVPLADVCHKFSDKMI